MGLTGGTAIASVVVMQKQTRICWEFHTRQWICALMRIEIHSDSNFQSSIFFFFNIIIISLCLYVYYDLLLLYMGFTLISWISFDFDQPYNMDGHELRNDKEEPLDDLEKGFNIRWTFKRPFHPPPLLNLTHWSCWIKNVDNRHGKLYQNVLVTLTTKTQIPIFSRSRKMYV